MNITRIRRSNDGQRSAVSNQGMIGYSQSRPLFWLIFLFMGLALVQLGLTDNNLNLTDFAPLLVVMVCSGATLFFLQRWGKNAYPSDPILLPVVFFLSGFGLILTARLAPGFVNRQLIWLVAATILLLLVNLIPKNLNWLYRYKYTWLIGGLLLLAITLVFGVNPSGFGARLWLQVGNVYFQPSEPLKLLLVVFLAAYLADRRRPLVESPVYIGPLPIPHPSYFGPMFLMWGFSIVLLIWQRDLGAALLFFGTFLGMLYAATGQKRYVWAGGLLLITAAIIGYAVFDVVRLRVEGFLNPWLDPSGRSFQIVQSLLAFASGSIFGQGLGQGLPTAIPVVHTDFVYAAIGEEYGMLGALGILLVFALLTGRAFHIGLRANTEFEQLLATGIGTMLGLQTIVITAGTLKLMPLTGVTLPFVSYGGSSLITSFLMVGLLLFISGEQKLNYRPVQGAPIYHLPLARAIFTGMLIVAGGLVFWQVAAAPFLVTRQDNPRRVVSQQRIDRGRLLSRQGIPIAETIIDENGLARRNYPYPGLSSVTGYYSIRHGVGGTEAVFDPTLRGTVNQTADDEFWRVLLHRPLVGEDVTLTIDLEAQAAADVALGDREGAVVVLDVETGEVLVMSSHPTFDPNTLDEQWDILRSDEQAPLLNRATQGLFPVGDLAWLIGLIGLQEAGATVPPNPLDMPVETLAAPLGSSGYLATAYQLGLTRALPGIRSQPGLLPQFPPEGKGTARDLAVTPLHLARVMAGLERDGRLPDPVLTPKGSPSAVPAISPETARQVRAMLPQIENKIIGLEGQANPQETGKTWLSWFVGLAPATAAPIEQPPSAAMSDDGLIFDPAKIKQANQPAAAPIAPAQTARYVVVAVVVTDAPDKTLAFRVAKAPLNVLLK